MTHVGAVIIGFLIGLVVCYFKQLKMLYDHRDDLSDVSDVGAGISAAKRLYERI